MRVRVRFAKTGKIRFISAIDLGRVWERALRKADLPIAFSEGFSPHPKISFGDALPLGLSSTAEFAELTFGGAVGLDDITRRLNTAFPEGIDVLEAVEVPEGSKRLGKLLQTSMWEIAYPPSVAAGDVADAVAALPADGPLLVQRERKGEQVTADVRPALGGVHASDIAVGTPADAVCGAAVRVILHHPGFLPDDAAAAHDDASAAARPDDLHTLLGLPDSPTRITRVAQGSATDDPPGVIDALTDRLTPLVPDARPQPVVGDVPQEAHP